MNQDIEIKNNSFCDFYLNYTRMISVLHKIADLYRFCKVLTPEGIV